MCSLSLSCSPRYLEMNAPGATKSRRLYVMNPNKVKTCKDLVEKHEARGDKILVFCDDVFGAKQYAEILVVPMIIGETHQDDRLSILEKFRTDSGYVWTERVPSGARPNVGNGSIWGHPI